MLHDIVQLGRGRAVAHEQPVKPERRWMDKHRVGVAAATTRAATAANKEVKGFQVCTKV